jgi:CBS domain-containing protein
MPMPSTWAGEFLPFVNLQRREIPVLVKDLMTREVSTCHPDNNLAELAELMWSRRCGALPILDSAGKVTGIVTDRDICIALGTRNVRASEVLAQEVSSPRNVCCAPHDDVRDALRTMAAQGVERLPVVDEAGYLVGILSVHDVVFRAGGGCSCLGDRELIDAMKAILEERIHELHADGTEFCPGIGVPMRHEWTSFDSAPDPHRSRPAYEAAA